MADGVPVGLEISPPSPLWDVPVPRDTVGVRGAIGESVLSQGGEGVVATAVGKWAGEVIRTVPTSVYLWLVGEDGRRTRGDGPPAAGKGVSFFFGMGSYPYVFVGVPEVEATGPWQWGGARSALVPSLCGKEMGGKFVPCMTTTATPRAGPFTLLLVFVTVLLFSKYGSACLLSVLIAFMTVWRVVGLDGGHVSQRGEVMRLVVQLCYQGGRGGGYLYLRYRRLLHCTRTELSRYPFKRGGDSYGRYAMRYCGPIVHRQVQRIVHFSKPEVLLCTP